MLDFPKIPFAQDYSYYEQIAKLGEELILIHTRDSKPTFQIIGTGDYSVGKYHYKDGCIWINSKQYIPDVDEENWTYYIGGYQPLQKWLKDIKNRSLSEEDISHYLSMITTIGKQSS